MAREHDDRIGLVVGGFAHFLEVPHDGLLGRVRVDQLSSAFEALVAVARRRRQAAPLMFVLGGMRMIGRLLHVVDGDEANAFVIVVDINPLDDKRVVEHIAHRLLHLI